MRLVMQELQVLFVHHRLDRLGNGARVLERLCSRGRGGEKRGREERRGGGEERRGGGGGGRGRKGGEEKRYVVGTVSGVGGQERGRRRPTEYVTYAFVMLCDEGWLFCGNSSSGSVARKKCKI